MLVKTPCLHLCVAKHQTACTIRLIFLRYVGWYIGQKTWNNRKTKKTFKSLQNMRNMLFQLICLLTAESKTVQWVHLHLKWKQDWSHRVPCWRGETCCSRCSKKESLSYCIWTLFSEENKAPSPHLHKPNPIWRQWSRYQRRIRKN